MKMIFGTDGIRGRANTGSITPEAMVNLARAIYYQIINTSVINKKTYKVILGRDTRLSGYMLESALASGFISEGVDVVFVSSIPTPAMPCLIKTYQADLGIMLTASHNPWSDNGVKIFDAEGKKINDQIQERLISHIGSYTSPGHAILGQTYHSSIACKLYCDHIISIFPKLPDLSDLHIVLDCAHGAVYRVAPNVIAKLNPKELTVLHNHPNGRNINYQCGTTDTKTLQVEVTNLRADIGFAFDGDGDRLIVVDQYGQVINGDQIIAAITQHWVKHENFCGSVVYTNMSNLALDDFLHRLGITTYRTAVGDRHVITQMQKISARLGGEQSGHIVLRDVNHTSDGIITAINLLNIMQIDNITAAEIGTHFTPIPQKLINLPKPNPMPDLELIVNNVKSILDDKGLILLHPSGTEPFIRVMVQAEDPHIMQTAIDQIISYL